MVIAKSGLNLRQEPSIKSKRLMTLPYKTLGKIESRGAALETLQGRSGFWFRTSVDGKVGHMFSGFVLLGESEEEVREQQSRIEARQAFEGGGFEEGKKPSHVRIIKLEGADLFASADLSQKAGRVPFEAILPVRSIKASAPNNRLVLEVEHQGKSQWLRTADAFASKATREVHFSEKYPIAGTGSLKAESRADLEKGLQSSISPFKAGTPRELAGLQLIPVANALEAHLLVLNPQTGRGFVAQNSSVAPVASLAGSMALKQIIRPGTCAASLEYFLIKPDGDSFHWVSMPAPAEGYCSEANGGEPRIQLREVADRALVIGHVVWPVCLEAPAERGPFNETKQIGWDTQRYFVANLAAKPEVKVHSQLPDDLAKLWEQGKVIPALSYE